MTSLVDDDNHEYHFSDSYSQIYIEDVNYNYSVWLTKQDLLNMLKLFEEQEQENR
ncbi:hypothetical protein phiA019_0155 [Aeromonas phage phiA019]|nr:hypothetical protein phiA009_0158 [Aeromonas phage phiA009]ULG01691.1 hypothetical protein phiA019_0155 [Aeromonas phage phiA019]